MRNEIANTIVRDNWNRWSDGYFARAYSNTDTLRRIKTSPHKVFPTSVWYCVNHFFPDLHGVRVCIPSSGDNIAAFAFHVLGAEVTSCDISSEQIKNAKRIADSERWDIDYCVCDSMELAGVESRKYDLVYTSNGVHVWIPNLKKMYGNFNRVLKNGGRYIFFETHPFIRPFDDSTNTLRMKKRYDDTADNGWRIQDFVNALIGSGFSLECLNESFAEKDCLGAEWWHSDQFIWDEMADWHKNPYAALPQWISLCVTKYA